MRCSLAPLSLLVIASACANDVEEQKDFDALGENNGIDAALSTAQKRERSERIKAVASARGVTNALVVAGVANHESGLAQCWSEATWACQGPYSNSCGGPSLAGSGDGACSLHQGGIGMFQLDAGTYAQTTSAYGADVVDVDGNVRAGVDVLIQKVWHCPNTPHFDDASQVVAWINGARPGTQQYETFLSAMAWCYNGCQPGWSCHERMRNNYRHGVDDLLSALGAEFWSTPSAPAAPPPPQCRSVAGGLGFDCAGPIAGMQCVTVDEPSDPHTWSDNTFCSTTDIGLQWSYAGPIAGKRCTQIGEGADPDTWDDNFLCVHEDAPYDFTWSSAGPIAGKSCVQWNEPSDPDTWNDNFLCFDAAPSCVDRQGDFAFSCAGPIAGMQCAQMLEGADPDTWNDNWFCSVVDVGLAFSSAGPIAGLDCAQLFEGADPDTWDDNWLCTDPARAHLEWSSAGPIDGLRCVRTWEPSDPHTWDDNYVCF